MTVVGDRSRGGGRGGAGGGAPRGGSAGASGAEEPDYRFETARDLRYVRGYVINRRTGEVLSSIIADVIRERRERKRKTA